MHSVFDPASPQARAVATLMWWMVGIGALVWASVVIAMFVAVRRGESPLRSAQADERRGRERWIVIATGATVVILFFFLGADFVEGKAAASHDDPALTVDVTGHQWWWQIEYPGALPKDRITTANELHVPVGRTVQIRLRAADVIHSFWVPNLNGKRDLIPGYVSTVWFRATTPGVYRGQCAEFCGLQHAKMALYVIAEDSASFERWKQTAQQPDKAPSDSITRAGQKVFLSANCSLCHAISGTDAWGGVGPTLSHLKARRTIAAGTLDNTRENLYGWISNPAAFKPGTLMPASTLAGRDLQARQRGV